MVKILSVVAYSTGHPDRPLKHDPVSPSCRPVALRRAKWYIMHAGHYRRSKVGRRVRQECRNILPNAARAVERRQLSQRGCRKLIGRLRTMLIFFASIDDSIDSRSLLYFISLGGIRYASLEECKSRLTCREGPSGHCILLLCCSGDPN